jgi:TonB family protein
MPNDFPNPVPSDRLGRMLLISMVFHMALFGGLVWYNSRPPKTKPLVPTYTVDLVNMPLPAPGPKTEAPPESPPPGPVVKPGVEMRDQPGPVAPVREPKKSGGVKPHPVEKKPMAQVQPAPPPPVKTAPSQPQPLPKVAISPQIAPKPVPAVSKPAEPDSSPLTIKPAPSPKKVVAPKTMAETRAPDLRVKKPVPEGATPVTEVTKAKVRERQIAQEINAANQKVAESSRNRKIQESVQDLEKGLAAQSRDRAYKEAVGQAAARLTAGKVSAKVSQGSGGGSGAGEGNMANAQTVAYGTQVSLTVRHHWQPNCLHRSNLQNLKAVIIIRIQADGSLSAAWFEKESGDRLFDQSAMTAVNHSSPLPALPPGQDKLEIGITFTPEWKASL